MKNRLIQFLPVLLIAFVSFATLGIVQAQNRNPCADTPEAERLLSELTTACSEQSSEKIEKFIEKWEQESRTATIYDTNDKLTTTVYQLLDYLMEKYYFNNKELSPDKQGRIVNGNLVFPGEVPVYILSDEEYLDCFRPEDLSSHRWFSQMDYTPQRIIKGYRPCNAPQQIRFLKLIPSYKKAIDSFIDSEVKKSKSFIYSQHALNFYTLHSRKLSSNATTDSGVKRTPCKKRMENGDPQQEIRFRSIRSNKTNLKQEGGRK